MVGIAVNGACTPAVAIRKGVLQGDPCCPLLLNFCFNSLMLTVAQSKYKQYGYMWGTDTSLTERSWRQFADDPDIIANNDKNAQVLLNDFHAWCTWADMDVRVDKCNSFGVRKENSVYGQHKPLVLVGESVIPSTEIGEDFKYLGKLFNMGMSTKMAEKLLSGKLCSPLHFAL